MKKQKRFLSLALALVLCLGLVPTAALAVSVTEAIPCKYDNARDFYEDLVAVYVDGKGWGYIDTTGREVIPCKYDDTWNFSEGLAAVRMGDDETGKWGFIDKAGREVIPCKYDNTWGFSEGLAAVRMGDDETGKWGFIDKAGREVIPCKYDYAQGFSEGLALVRMGDYITGKWGLIDTTGREIAPCKYDNVQDFSEGLALVCMDDQGTRKYGFIDKSGKEVVPCQYSSAWDFSGGFAMICEGDCEDYDAKYWFIDTTGQEITGKYDWAWEPYEGFAAVGVATGEKTEYGDPVYKFGFIDKTGREVIPCKYDNLYVPDQVNDVGFYEGLAAVYLDGKGWGYIDTTGREVVPCKYDRACNFSEGLAAVRMGDNATGKWGFIDKTGQEVIPCQYSDVLRPFSDGVADVRIDTGTDQYGNVLFKFAFIDKTGRETFSWDYTKEIGDISGGLAAMRTGGYPDGRWGFIDITGREIVPPKYKDVSYTGASEGFIKVEDESDKYGFLRVDDAPSASTAYASTQTVLVDGKPVTFNAYALKDQSGFETNYIKLRDVADVLNGTLAQFQVGWDGAITITTQAAYTPNGTENVQNFQGDQSYSVNKSPVTVNGAAADLEAITLTDASGGGYTYFKLRDLGEALGFDVSWDAQSGISIDPNHPYDPNN